MLQAADVGEAFDVYTKEDAKTTNERHYAGAIDYCERLGAYRMPLCWTYVDVYRDVVSSSTDDIGMTPTSTPAHNASFNRSMDFAHSDTESIGSGKSIVPLFLRDLWPRQRRLEKRFIDASNF